MKRPGSVLEVGAEICCQSLCVSADKQTYEDETQQSCNFREGKYVLNDRPVLHAKDVDDREHNDHQDSHQVLRVQPNVHVVEDHRSNTNRRYFPGMNEPVYG